MVPLQGWESSLVPVTVWDDEICDTILAVQAGETSSGLSFIVGGPHGTSDAVKQRADRVLRLSSMVLNHQVAHGLMPSLFPFLGMVDSSVGC